MNNAISTAPKGRILVATLFVDTWLLFISRALCRAGYDVTIVTHVEAVSENHDHTDIMKYFLPNPFCRLVEFKDAALALNGMSFDFAIAGLRGSSTQEEKQKVLDLIGATPLRAVVFRHYDNRLPAMGRLAVKEARSPFIRRAQRVLVENYGNASWTLRFLAKPFRLGVIPHQRVICEGLPEGLLDQTQRPFLFNFLGTYFGPRIRVIDRLEPLLNITAGGDQIVTVGGKSVRIVWHADRADSTRKRPLNEYLDTLRGSYFTLCLPGHTAITHRVLEAIHCGSIPVMPEESVPQYLLPLEHGRNCWLVKDNDWESALTALIALDEKKVSAMQEAVKKLAVGEASIPALEKRCLQMLGLNPT